MIKTLLFLLLSTLPSIAEAVTVVTVRPLSSFLFHPQHEAPANIVALNDAPLSMEVAGLIAEIPIEVGQIVQKGDLLARLDSWDYQNQEQQAQATLEEAVARWQLAQRQQQRTLELRRGEQASAEQLEQRSAELQSLAARLKQQRVILQGAQDRLARTVLRAPFTGVVVERSGQLHTWSAPVTLSLSKPCLCQFNLHLGAGSWNAVLWVAAETTRPRHEF